MFLQLTVSLPDSQRNETQKLSILIMLIIQIHNSHFGVPQALPLPSPPPSP